MYDKIIISNGSEQYVTCIDIVKSMHSEDAVKDWRDSLHSNGMFPTIYTERCSEDEALRYFNKQSAFMNKPFSEISKGEKILGANEMILLN